MVHVNISFMNFLWFPSFVNSKLGIHSHSNSICTLFPSLPPSLLWDYWFSWFSIPFICTSSMMKSGLICPIAISLKLSITFGCNNWKNMTLVYTQWCLMTTFMLSNSLHYIDSTCKVVHLVMVMIGMNCCWEGLMGQVILLDLW